MVGTTLYRFDDEPPIFDRGHRFCLRRLIVVRESAMCVWMADSSWPAIEVRRMSKTARRPWAWPTVEEAALSYAVRKAHHIAHANRSLRRAEALLDAIKAAHPSIRIASPLAIDPSAVDYA